MNKKYLFFIIFIIIFSTVLVILNNPVMHKQLSVNVIDYLIKFNDDGSITTTKQTTTHIIERKGE